MTVERYGLERNAAIWPRFQLHDALGWSQAAAHVRQHQNSTPLAHSESPKLYHAVAKAMSRTALRFFKQMVVMKQSRAHVSH